MEKFLKRKDVSFKIDPKQNLTQMKVLVWLVTKRKQDSELEAL